MKIWVVDVGVTSDGQLRVSTSEKLDTPLFEYMKQLLRSYIGVEPSAETFRRVERDVQGALDWLDKMGQLHENADGTVGLTLQMECEEIFTDGFD